MLEAVKEDAGSDSEENGNCCAGAGEVTHLAKPHQSCRDRGQQPRSDGGLTRCIAKDISLLPEPIPEISRCGSIKRARE